MIMDQNNLYDIFQNTAISTIALHSFSLGYFKVAKNIDWESNFPKMEYLFFVLPIVYNQSSMKTFRSSNQLYTALAGNKSITLGLQDRANKMSIQTFDALNLAFSKNILDYNKTDKTIEIKTGFKDKKIILPTSMMDLEHSVKMIQDCAFKLGGIFAKTNKKNLQINLNIVF